MKKINILILLLIVIFSSCHTVAQNKMEQKEFIKLFISDFENYQMNIQSAGIAIIPKATISAQNELYIEYSYRSEGEDRNGKMKLLLNYETKRFEGSWKTVADNGNVYQGDLHFIFKKDGQANGLYQFGGIEYKITIFKK